MNSAAEAAIEATRRLWTPDREAEEISADLAPQTALDSMVRHLLHALVQQGGRPLQISLDTPNTGVLRWEQVTHEALPGRRGSTVLNIWVEDQ